MSNVIWVFVILGLLFISGSSYSTNSNGQKELDKVTNLPGLGFNVNFAHYAGHVTVNEESQRSLFYWFFEAVDDPSSKPLLLWLNGGPGCSSIGYGLAEELGPFHIKKDGKTLYWNPYTWNLAANLLFLDSPVGVGYAYSNTSSDHLNNSDARTAADSLEFLLKWLERFPEYKGREFYISGESYAGHYIPQLSQAIVRYNRRLKYQAINLKGFLVGNALTDDYHDHIGLFQFLWSAGLISDQTYKQANVLCDNDSFLTPSEQCNKTLNQINVELGHIDTQSIFTPACTAKFSILNHLLKRSNMVGQLGRSYDPCTELYSKIYFNLPEVQQALHVHKRDSSFEWVVCSDEIFNSWKDYPKSVLDVYRELIESGLRIWIFSGDADAVIPVTSTRYTINALNLPTVSPWRAWYDDDGQVGGWTQEYKGLTFVAVRGAGHEVPLHRPKQALILVKSFLAGKSLPSLEQISDS
ncbi:unnamed protein product [Withania somnifera]